MNSKSVEEYIGPLHWHLLDKTTQKSAPLYTGIYIMKHIEPFGRLRGTSDILYIGSTTSSIRQRLLGYLNPGPTQRTNIRINKMLQKYNIRISWHKMDHPKELETQLLEQYYKEHDEQPPFNFQGPTNRNSSRTKAPIRRTGNRELILKHLQENLHGACDDCISTRLNIKPRQQVNQICNRLANQSLIKRQRMKCPRCTKKMLVNRVP
jgi:hypothetical protein